MALRQAYILLNINTFIYHTAIHTKY